jgi:biopolymer transport protein ExbD
MAGMQTGDSADNSVNVNIVPMVDVIFCLCIFFMCSFHFKQLEGKVESWMPTDKGARGERHPVVVLEEIRIIMKWANHNEQTLIQVNNRPVNNSTELQKMLLAHLEDYKRSGALDIPASIDAEPMVPWQDIVSVMDICKNLKIEKLEFAAPRGDFFPEKIE